MREYVSHFEEKNGGKVAVISDEITRCKDCIYYSIPKRYKKEYCTRGAYIKTEPGDFCSFGERKDNGEDN